MVIGGESVVCVLCHGDSRGRRGVGVAVPWWLVGRAWSGWRFAVVIRGEGIAWMSQCRGDWWGERGLGGAVPWLFAGKAWRGCRCAMAIGGESVVCRCDWRGRHGSGVAVPW